jgi:hypothetical protein
VKCDRRTVLRGATIGFLGAGAGCLDGTGSAGERANAPLTAAETRRSTEASTGTATGTRTSTTATTESDATTTTEPRTDATSTEGTPSTAESTSTPTATCEEGLRRLRIDFPADFELAYGQGFGFELTAEPEAVAVGDDLTITLRNTTDEPQTTGPKGKYAIERRIEDGWRHVLQVPEGYSPPDGRVTHRPGEGFTWRLPVSREGFSAGPYTVCAPLRSGEYHFTYWGFPDGKRGLTIAFDIERGR